VAEGPSRGGDPVSWIDVANDWTLCCGVIHGGAKFCIAPACGCTFQSHQKKADFKDNSVYLTAGTLGRSKATGFTGWCAREAVFGNQWGELDNLSLSARSFRRFGDTLGAVYDAGHDPVEADWESIVLSASRLMQVGTPKCFKSRPVDQAAPTVSSALKMWAKGPGQGAEVNDEEEDAFDPLRNLSFNLELFQEAVQDMDVRAKQHANHQVLEAEVFGNQLHDARIRLGKILVSSLIRMSLLGMPFQPCMASKPSWRKVWRLVWTS
jgi:hypothetical protein